MAQDVFDWSEQVCAEDEVNVVEEGKKFRVTCIHVKKGESAIDICDSAEEEPIYIKKKDINRVVFSKPALFAAGTLLFQLMDEDGNLTGVQSFTFKKMTNEMSALLSIIKNNIKNVNW